MAQQVTTRTISVLVSIVLLAACASAAPTPAPAELGAPSIEVVADGLFAPLGLAALPDGGLLVAEEGTGRRDDSAGVSLITPAGDVGRLVSGFPSSRDSGDLAGANLVSVAPDGETSLPSTGMSTCARVRTVTVSSTAIGARSSVAGSR